MVQDRTWDKFILIYCLRSDRVQFVTTHLVSLGLRSTFDDVQAENKRGTA
jgi:hypothetical protein